MSDEQRYLDMREQEQRILERLDQDMARWDDWKLTGEGNRLAEPVASAPSNSVADPRPMAVGATHGPLPPDFEQWLTSGPMPDYEPESDDDETIEPYFNDTGDFGDQQQENEDDNE